MSVNLTFTQTFDNVTQIEVTDDILGGPGQIANMHAQKLGNRTEWLKAHDLTDWGGSWTFTNSGANVWNNAASTKQFHMRSTSFGAQYGHVWLSGNIRNFSGSTPATADIMTLGVGFRPNNDTFVMAWSTSPTPGPILLKISSTGKVTSTSPADGTIYLDGVNFKIGVEAY